MACKAFENNATPNSTPMSKANVGSLVSSKYLWLDLRAARLRGTYIQRLGYNHCVLFASSYVALFYEVAHPKGQFNKLLDIKFRPHKLYPAFRIPVVSSSTLRPRSTAG